MRFKVQGKIIRTGTEPALPTKATMLKNAGKALVRNAVAVLIGNSLYAPEEVKEKRLTICRKCPLFRHSDMRCAACGCKLNPEGDVPSKISLAAEFCPVRKW